TIANNLVPGGYEYAAGKYNGWFISPEVAYGFQHSLGYNLTLTPSARVRYLAAGFGGYQEIGSSTNLTVASRTSHNFEERGEFKLTHTTNATPTEQLQLSGTAGLIALQRVGDSNVNTILLGQSLAFATPGKGSIVGFYAGAGFDWRNASGISVFGAAEFTAMSDQSQTITGRGGVKVSF
ncbi:MAG: autotransporter domain-containing protein, partial [Afipia sp.]|nr:autotransporter domain-containing protein [Afipia sp.]